MPTLITPRANQLRRDVEENARCNAWSVDFGNSSFGPLVQRVPPQTCAANMFFEADLRSANVTAQFVRFVACACPNATLTGCVAVPGCNPGVGVRELEVFGSPLTPAPTPLPTPAPSTLSPTLTPTSAVPVPVFPPTSVTTAVTVPTFAPPAPLSTATSASITTLPLEPVPVPQAALIGGSVAGGLVAIGILVVVVAVCRRNRKRASTSAPASTEMRAASPHYDTIPAVPVSQTAYAVGNLQLEKD
jgi:hypothetical protein